MASLWKSFTDKLKVIYLTRVSMFLILCVWCLSVCVYVTVQGLWCQQDCCLYFTAWGKQQRWIIVGLKFSLNSAENVPYCRKCIHKKQRLYEHCFQNMGTALYLLILPYSVIIIYRGIPGGEENGKERIHAHFLLLPISEWDHLCCSIDYV